MPNRTVQLLIEPVRLIQEVEDEAYLLADLAAATPVIVSPLPFATDGMTVRVAAPLETSPAERPAPTREAARDGNAPEGSR